MYCTVFIKRCDSAVPMGTPAAMISWYPSFLNVFNLSKAGPTHLYTTGQFTRGNDTWHPNYANDRGESEFPTLEIVFRCTIHEACGSFITIIFFFTCHWVLPT